MTERTTVSVLYRLFGRKRRSGERKCITMRARFLDGPLAGETRDIEPCLTYIPSIKFDGCGFAAVVYRWATAYPNAEVNFMCLDEQEPGYAVMTI